MAAMVIGARHRRVFDSVFQTSSDIFSQPTPVATPVSAFISPGQPFGGGSAPIHNTSLDLSLGIQDHKADSTGGVEEQLIWNRSWHRVTTHLSLFTSGSNLELSHIGSINYDTSPPVAGPEIIESLRDVLAPECRLPGATHHENVIEWYSQKVRSHFLHHVLPLLSEVFSEPGSDATLPRTVQILDRAHGLYLGGLSLIVKQLDVMTSGSSVSVIQSFRRDLHAIISKCMSGRLLEALRRLLVERINVVLDIPSPKHVPMKSTTVESRSSEKADARRDLLGLVESLHNVGLGGEKLQIIFAELMNEAMSVYVYTTYSGVWGPSNPSQSEGDEENQVSTKGSSRAESQDSADEGSLLPRIVNHSSSSYSIRSLCEWIENQYSQLAVQVLIRLDKTEVAWNDVEKWKEMCIGRLASLRISELFEIVVSWPNSGGALDDLRTAVTTPQRRLQLTEVFSSKLKERLLHPGVSTLQILRTYISMIWSFHSLDHSKVLLDRVAYPLQVYLCSREDAVRIIITGLLSDTVDSSGMPIEPGGEKLVELAILLNQGSDELGQRADEEFDWNDIDWVPDPVDAGPGFRRSKSADVIGTLISVLGSQEIFIKEFQNIVGENLLKNEGDFEKEIKLLELLKTRFGEAPLQSCEVMLKDIQDSRRVDTVIRRTQNLDSSKEEIAEGADNPEGLLKPSLHAKILSRLFWPQLHDGSYYIPDEIAHLQKRYEVGFESLKNARKLTWLHALGQATVELQLLDRVVSEEVHTWQATLIWAFQSDQHQPESLTRTVEELMELLNMDETLVRSGLNFWVSKMVLQEISKDKYVVLETLNQEDRERSNTQAAAAAAANESNADDAALMTNDELSSEKMEMYWKFIQGMLTNSAAQMPLQQIAMMLKMLIVDGFPYSNEELQEFLGKKVTAGELEMVGGKYKLKK